MAFQMYVKFVLLICNFTGVIYIKEWDKNDGEHRRFQKWINYRT